MPTDIVMGSRVRLHLRLELHDGTVVEDSFESGEPLEFTLGDGTLVQGLELATGFLRRRGPRHRDRRACPRGAWCAYPCAP